jgi:hypothetical protein
MKRIVFTTIENQPLSYEELTSMTHPKEANEETLKQLAIMAMNIDYRVATFELVEDGVRG